MQIVYKFYKNFSKVLDELTFAECYPPNQNPADAPEHIYNLVNVLVSHVSKVNTDIRMLVGR